MLSIGRGVQIDTTSVKQKHEPLGFPSVFSTVGVCVSKGMLPGENPFGKNPLVAPASPSSGGEKGLPCRCLFTKTALCVLFDRPGL